RGSILPRLTWRSRAAAPPPSIALRAASSMTRIASVIAAPFVLKLSALVEICDVRTVIEGGRHGCERSTSSHRLHKEFAPDQHSADFRGAGADFVKLRIPEQPADRIIVRIAIAAKRLNCLQSHSCRLFRRIQYAAGGVLAGRLAAIEGGCNRIDIGARR